ncbi:MAG: hemolysin family protein, partial [Janthinobacterium lividum]
RDVEPRLRLGRDSAALSASVLSHTALAGLALVLASRVPWHGPHPLLALGQVILELGLAVLFFGRLLPQVIFTRTPTNWSRRLALPLRVLLYLALPITLLISLVMSIASLAEPEQPDEERPQSEAVDALLEAGEEEGILEESDRELVRSVVEFGDKVVREVMTPRPDVIAVPSTMSLASFTEVVRRCNISRVPVYTGSLDNVTGIAFARDLLGIDDADAGFRTVAGLARAAVFIPETKKVNELLREMQRGKQHMSLVIDEYGGVAGLVTIEDLLEAIVGNIEDEHDTTEAGDAPVAEESGTFIIPGSFEVSRLRELFLPHSDSDSSNEEDRESDIAAETREQMLPQLLTGYDAATVGGLVSEIAGHIPLPGEVVEDGPLRLEVLASTDRLVERVRVGLQSGLNITEPE